MTRISFFDNAFSGIPQAKGPILAVIVHVRNKKKYIGMLKEFFFVNLFRVMHMLRPKIGGGVFCHFCCSKWRKNDKIQQLRLIYVYFEFTIDITRKKFTILSPFQYSHKFLYISNMQIARNRDVACMSPL